MIINFLMQYAKDYQNQLDADKAQLITDIKNAEAHNQKLQEEKEYWNNESIKILNDINTEKQLIDELTVQEHQYLDKLEEIKKSLQEKQDEIKKQTDSSIIYAPLSIDTK